MLLRYHQRLTGRVLEIGCGAGRLTGYLAELTSDLEAFDVSPAMVDHCRHEYPHVRSVRVGDMTDLLGYATGLFDAVVAIQDVIGVLDHSERLAVLAEMRRLWPTAGCSSLLPTTACRWRRDRHPSRARSPPSAR